MKRGCTVGLILFFSLFLLLNNTANAADTKIGVIDLQEILQKSKAAKDARNVFLTDVESKRTVLKSKEAEVLKMQETLQKEAKGKPEDQLAKERDKLNEEVKNLRRLKSDLEEELKKKDMDLSRKLLSDIQEVVSEYRKKKKLTAVFEKKAIVSYDEAVDVTADIIAEFDKKSKK